MKNIPFLGHNIGGYCRRLRGELKQPQNITKPHQIVEASKNMCLHE